MSYFYNSRKLYSKEKYIKLMKKKLDWALDEKERFTARFESGFSARDKKIDYFENEIKKAEEYDYFTRVCENTITKGDTSE